MVLSARAERIVIYTALAGSGRDAVPGVDYVCFTDQALTSQVWQIHPFTWTHHEAVRTAKHPKVLPHKYFPDHNLSVWIDANMTPGPDIAKIARYYLRFHDLAVHKHPWRDCLFKEAEVVARVKKDFPEVINKALVRYHKAGMPQNFGLCECGVLFRRHHDPSVKQFMDLWWKEISIGTNSDQMPFSFAWWKTGFVPKVIQGNVRENPYLSYRPHPPIIWGKKEESKRANRHSESNQVAQCL